MLKSLEEPAVGLMLPDGEATERLGADLALALKAGDCVHLHGDLGAGKTALARGLVRATVGGDIDVPSPTFTLAQSYEGRVPVLHTDLYRIENESEIDELGLDEALDVGIVLVEWPERGGGRLAPATLNVELVEEVEGRSVTLWGPALDRAVRTLEVRAFLTALGKPTARREHLTGDASARSYETIPDGTDLPRVLMNAPDTPDGPAVHDGLPYSKVAHLAEDVRPFVGVAEALRTQGFAAPRIHAADLDAGLLLIENLGTGTVIENGKPLEARYESCAALLAELHGSNWSREMDLPDGAIHTVPEYDRAAMQIEVSLLADWYARDVLRRELSTEERKRFKGLWDALIDRLDAYPKTLVLRDFHSPNIVWRDDRSGAERIGLIDFQDAVWGPGPYDLASLAQDARTDVPEALEMRLIETYWQALSGNAAPDSVHLRPAAKEAFEEVYAILAAQRASKILGIFVRLDLRDGKPAYRAHMPRLRGYLSRSLRHPVLADLAAFYAETFDLR